MSDNQTQGTVQPWAIDKFFKSSNSILTIQFPDSISDIEKTVDRLIMTGKSVSVELKNESDPDIRPIKKLSSCLLKIEEGIGLLTENVSNKTREYRKELSPLKEVLSKSEKKYAKKNSVSWIEWVIVFAFSYWWVPIVIVVGIYLYKKFL